jgi:3-(3-hydroxy-phenyl)propionate hydroxylase
MRDTQGHMHIGADGGVIRYLGTAGRPRPFAWANDYFFYQPELEAELRRGLGRFPHVELQLGTECLAVAQDDAGVNLEVGQGDRRRTVRARWAIACDGASSATRKGLGVKLDDLGFEEPWLVIDAEVDGPLEFSAFTGVPEDADLQQLSIMLCDPRRPATLVPGRGDHRRWEFMLLPGEDATPSDEDIRKLIAPWTAGATSRVIRAATYRFHGLIAEHWRAGSVFLAGDAAHQTPPFFGQGMCHGMRDVANLVWKLRLVRDGLAGDDLLETYQTEREPQVRAVIAAAVEAGRYICMLDPELAAQRDAAMRARFHDPVRTASDLIPAIKGVTLAGAGGRFIQPWIDVGGRRMRLDDFTGGGFVLIERRFDVRRPSGRSSVYARRGLSRRRPRGLAG